MVQGQYPPQGQGHIPGPGEDFGPAIAPYSTPPLHATQVNSVGGTTYNVQPADDIVIVTTGALNVTVNLPASALLSGRRILVMKADSGAGSVIVAAAGSDTIEGNASKTIASRYGKVGVLTDASGTWYDLGVGGV